MRLCAEGDVSIVSMRGDVSLMTGRTLNLDAGERARVTAPEIDLHAALPASSSTNCCRLVARRAC